MNLFKPVYPNIGMLAYDDGDGERDDEGDDDDDEVDRVEPPFPAEEDGRCDGVDSRDDFQDEVGRQNLESDRIQFGHLLYATFLFCFNFAFK